MMRTREGQRQQVETEVTVSFQAWKVEMLALSSKKKTDMHCVREKTGGGEQGCTWFWKYGNVKLKA